MARYRFVTVWRLQAPIERVFAEIDAIDAWPEWWPNVRRVEKLAGGDAGGIGAAFSTTFVGRLPYPLRFDLRVTRREPPTSVVGDATGELEGVGEWTLWEEGGWTLVRYVWAIRTTAAWMNLLAPLPFVDSIFRLNHHSVMRSGLVGIRARLGGVAGTYTRED
ncbi:MAG: SRPBCC family protein [Actinomycetota bacterium]